MNIILPRRKFIAIGAATLGAMATSTLAGSTASAKSDFKVAIVLPGVITDKGWNQSGYEGAKGAAEKIEGEFAYIEKVAQADQVEALSDYARRGYNVVIGHGGQFDAAIQQVSEQFPKTFFLAVNGQVTGPNIAAVQTNIPELSYLVGVLAASMTKSNHVGYITGITFKSTKLHFRGFELGAKAIKPDIKCTATYTGDFNDIAKGKEAALAMIGNGVDVLFQSLDNSAPAVLTAAQEKGIYTIANYADLFDVAPKSVLTSVVQSVGLASGQLAELASKEQLKGQIYLYGFESPDIVKLGKINPLIPADVVKKIESVKSDLIAKKIDFEDCKAEGEDTVCLKA